MSELPKPPEINPSGEHELDLHDARELFAVVRSDGTIEDGWMELGRRYVYGTTYVRVGKRDDETGQLMAEWVPEDTLNSWNPDREFDNSHEAGSADAVRRALGEAVTAAPGPAIDNLEPGGRRYYDRDSALVMYGDGFVVGEGLGPKGRKYYIVQKQGSDGSRIETEVPKEAIDGPE